MTIGVAKELADVATRYFNLTAPLGYATEVAKLTCREELRITLQQFYAEEKRSRERGASMAEAFETMRAGDGPSYLAEKSDLVPPIEIEPVEVKKHGLVFFIHRRDERCPDDCEMGVGVGFSPLPPFLS